jgi:hypothetical protein
MVFVHGKSWRRKEPRLLTAETFKGEARWHGRIVNPLLAIAMVKNLSCDALGRADKLANLLRRHPGLQLGEGASRLLPLVIGISSDGGTTGAEREQH